MLANTYLISSNFTALPHTTAKLKPSPHTHKFNSVSFSLPKTTATSRFSLLLKPHNKLKASLFQFHKRVLLQRCHSILDSKNLDEEENPVLDDMESSVLESKVNVQGGRDWTTSIFLFVLWGGLMYYVFNLSPNQTPSRDMYFLNKLLNLKGHDGFVMNEVLVSLWYIMGLWPLVYSMLLLPTGRSSKSKIPVWPFLILSFFGGAYALLPYFVLWKPPPPPVEETELSRWPLNFLESKLTAGIHVMSIDFTLLSTFAAFWVYNDMTARKWYDKGSWLLPVSLVPFLGPALYLFLRPSLSEMSVSVGKASSEQE
ncbi:uncharacterized protein LOC123223815 isoform X3 [Mangifera indica]|uniref:uncharacterized protein LOC123223815 isoform X3 n=1 Tax=Mangifera indica TaxID=29780 RepID=UPI001CFA3B8B|nr:uncharacterized protein LOC123223815 isoform X3 [Mangifera indica]